MKAMTNMRRAQLALVVGAAITLAACGSSGGKTSVGAGATPSTATPDRAGEVVKAANVTSVGAVLVDADGMTLYTLKKGSTPVPCTGQCPTVWPPLLLASGTTTAVGAPGITGLGTKAEAAGTQVTAAGAPLYRFSGDQAPGDANGDGIVKFGGVWHVVAAPDGAVAATPTTQAPAPTTPTTTSSYGGGY
jgi:predicted lipoprotein with Yx(FWY)xxD motif